MFQGSLRAESPIRIEKCFETGQDPIIQLFLSLELRDESVITNWQRLVTHFVKGSAGVAKEKNR